MTHTLNRNGPRYKWEVLLLLWIAFFLNQADRQVFNVVIPYIKLDLGISDMQVGLVATLFNIIFALMVPLGGYAGDIFSRKWVVVLSILFWSLSTMMTGISNGILMLIIMRSVATGGGEAFFGPANYTLLAEYHKETRAFAMSIHQTSYYIGIILSGYLAGLIGEKYGWRNAFYIFGAVGVIHGILLIFRLKDKKSTKQNVKVERIEFFKAMKILYTTPTALLLTISYTGLIFVLSGYLTWTPTYLYENFGMSLSRAGFHSMFYTHLFAFVGILIAGRISDRMALRDHAVRLKMQGAGLLFAVPFIILIGNSNTLPMVYIGLAGFGFGRAFFDANTYTVLYDVIPLKFRASASGVKIMTGFLMGSFSPLILGFLKPKFGLSFGISMLSIVWIICGFLLFFAARFTFRKDYEKIVGN